MTDSHLVVDGSNIATEGRTVPSLSQLDEAVRSFTSEFDYGNVIVVVDATFAHRIDPSERQAYEEAVVAGEILTPPAGAIGRGDAFVLEIADRSGGSVLSNDSFQEFHADHEWLFEEGRLWGGKPVPGVGWVFVTRLPVRGPVSQRSKTSAAKKHKSSTSAGSSTPKSKTATKPQARTASAKAKSSVSAPGKGQAGSSTRSTGRRSTAPKTDTVATTTSKKSANNTGGARPARKREIINSPNSFLSFITDHQPGDDVIGEVIEFASHGAYVDVDETRCYLSLKSMGDPAPRSPRDVLQLGEVRSFIVQGFDTPRRGIDLALPDPVANGVDPADRRSSSETTDSDDGSPRANQDNFLDQESAEEAQVAATTKKKTAAKKAPAKKTAAKKG